jgi:copper(I)-binding protein
MISSANVIADVQSPDRQGAKTDQVTLERAWSPETIPGRSNGVVYLDIQNASDAMIQLVSVSSDIASKASIHESLLVDGMMKMQSVSSVTIQPGERVSLEPGGLHVMLMGLKEQLAVGNSHMLVLNFSTGISRELEVAVFPISQLSFPD